MESFEERYARISAEIKQAHIEMADSHADFDKSFEAARAEMERSHADFDKRFEAARAEIRAAHANSNHRSVSTAQKQHRACRTVHSHVQQHHDVNVRLHQEEHQRFMDQQQLQMHMNMHHGF